MRGIWWSTYLHKFEFKIYFVLDSTSQAFRCPQCGKAYKHKGSLYKHMRWECGKEPQFKCSYCPYMAKQKGRIMMHVAVKHSKREIVQITK